MERRRLWEIGCGLQDAVLWTTFTPDELTRIASALEFPLEGLEPDASLPAVLSELLDGTRAFASL